MRFGADRAAAAVGQDRRSPIVSGVGKLVRTIIRVRETNVMVEAIPRVVLVEDAATDAATSQALVFSVTHERGLTRAAARRVNRPRRTARAWETRHAVCPAAGRDVIRFRAPD